MKMEQPTIEQPEEEKLKKEIDLEKELYPQKGETLDVWAKRIGGSHFEIVDDLQKYSVPKSKKDKPTPVLVDSEGVFMLNDKNIVEYFGKKAKEIIDEQVSKKNPYIQKRGTEYWIEKDLFKPEKYLGIFVDLAKICPKINGKVIIDKRFSKNVEEWVEKKKVEKAKEEKKKPASAEATAGKPEKKPEEKEREEESQPAAGQPEAEKPLTLDEKIAQKQKELEKAEQKQAIYRPLGWFRKKPVVRDLGYYANEAEIRNLKKEMKELEKERGEKEKPAKKEKIRKEIKEPKTLPEEVPEAPTSQEQLRAIEKNLKSVYGKIGYRKRKIREGGVLGRADLEKQMTILEKERDKLKETKEKIKERLAIEKRLKEIPEEIKKSTVLEQSKLEKEQTRLEKRLRKIK